MVKNLDKKIVFVELVFGYLLVLLALGLYLHFYFGRYVLIPIYAVILIITYIFLYSEKLRLRLKDFLLIKKINSFLTKVNISIIKIKTFFVFSDMATYKLFKGVIFKNTKKRDLRTIRNLIKQGKIIEANKLCIKLTKKEIPKENLVEFVKKLNKKFKK